MNIDKVNKEEVKEKDDSSENSPWVSKVPIPNIKRKSLPRECKGYDKEDH